MSTAVKKAPARKAGRPQTKSAGGKKGQEKEETAFEHLFIDLLKDIYWAEEHLVKALQQMSDAATTRELRDAFEDHLYVTKKHVGRLERVFKLLGKPAQSKKCAAMEGLTKEAEEVIKSTDEGSMTRDAGLIIAAQKVEHYEIAAYGSLVQVALTLGHDEVADILNKTLQDEEDTDQALTSIAETYVNPLSDQEGGEGDEGGEEEEEEGW